VKLSLLVNVLISSQVINHIDVELKFNISELSSISIIREGMVSDHMLLMYIAFSVCLLNLLMYNITGGWSHLCRYSSDYICHHAAIPESPFFN
jgi:hypothetical protein